MPTWGKPAAITALPHPPKVSQNVPMASAASFFVFMDVLPHWDSISVPALGQVKRVKYPPEIAANRVGLWANTQAEAIARFCNQTLAARFGFPGSGRRAGSRRSR